MKSRRCVAITALVVLWFSSAPALAQGLWLTQLPPDGSWAEYEIKTIVSQNGTEIMKQTGKMVIRSVGKVQEKGEDCRWIEFHTEVINMDCGNEAMRKATTKVLIKEKFFKDGKNPEANVVRVWLKDGGGEPEEMKRESDEFKNLAETFSGMEEIKKLVKQPIDVPGVGKLDCDHEQGTVKPPRGDAVLTMPGRAEIWKHTKSPFGVVQLKLEMKGKVSDKETELVTETKLIKMGHGATSALPDKQ